MFELDVPKSEAPKLPTLRQWLKAHGRKKLANSYPVLVLWRPGVFPNYTFSTEYFRYSISENNPAFNQIETFINSCLDAGIGISIVVSESRDGSASLRGSDGQWQSEPIGDSGVRFRVIGAK